MKQGALSVSSCQNVKGRGSLRLTGCTSGLYIGTVFGNAVEEQIYEIYGSKDVYTFVCIFICTSKDPTKITKQKIGLDKINLR